MGVENYFFNKSNVFSLLWGDRLLWKLQKSKLCIINLKFLNFRVFSRHPKTNCNFSFHFFVCQILLLFIIKNKLSVFSFSLSLSHHTEWEAKFNLMEIHWGVKFMSFSFWSFVKQFNWGRRTRIKICTRNYAAELFGRCGYFEGESSLKAGWDSC